MSRIFEYIFISSSTTEFKDMDESDANEFVLIDSCFEKENLYVVSSVFANVLIFFYFTCGVDGPFFS